MGIALGVLMTTPSWAMWARFEKDTPVPTLIANLEQSIRREPKNAAHHFALARVYSLAFSTGSETVQVGRGDRGEVTFPGYATVRVQLENGKRLTPARLRYLKRSISEYEIATRLDGKNALAFLGRGWMNELSGTLPGHSLTGADGETALAAYRRAVSLSAPAERMQGVYGPAPDAAIAKEAAKGVLRILSARKTTKGAEYGSMKSLVAELDKFPMAITPVVIPLGGESSLGELLSTQTSRFDLAGDGVVREWPWVKPTTGILVWDPRNTGEITSGRQLFGTATWWMFFRDGYAALASLDASGDGWLRGSELSGIRVWRDANANGKSEPGEVQSLSTYRITGLNTRATGTSALGPWAEDGVEWDGRRMTRSYDWTPTSQTNKTTSRR